MVCHVFSNICSQSCFLDADHAKAKGANGSSDMKIQRRTQKFAGLLTTTTIAIVVDILIIQIGCYPSYCLSCWMMRQSVWPLTTWTLRSYFSQPTSHHSQRSFYAGWTSRSCEKPVDWIGNEKNWYRPLLLYLEGVWFPWTQLALMFPKARAL